MRSIFEIQIANKFSSVFVRLLGCLFLVIAFSGGNVFAQSNSNESKPSTKQETEKSSRRKTSGSTTQETAQPKTQPQPPQPPQTAQSATTQPETAQPKTAQSSTNQTKTEPTKEELAAIEYSVDSKEPIFEYIKTVSHVAPTNGKQFIPDLQIFPNGRAVLGGRNPSIEPFDSKISQSELKALLHLVVNQNRFLEIDEEDMEKRMKANEKVKTQIADGNTVAFRVNLPKGRRQIQIYTLYNAVKNYPEVEDIQRLGRIEKACDAIISKIHLGEDGPAILATVNKACAAHEADIEPFELSDMRLATRMKRGRFQVSFQRIYPAVGKTPERKLNAIYFRKDEKSEPTVKFYGLPRK